MVKKIGIIGFGKIGKALIEGLIKGEKINKRNVFAFDIDPKKMKEIKNLGYIVADSIKDVYEKSFLIIIAVKPEDYKELFLKLKDYTVGGIVISVAAGITLSNLEANLPNVHFIRAIPNVAIEIADGVTAFSKGKNTTKAEYKEVLELFKTTGTVVDVNEKDLNKVIPLSSSMPAFVYSIINNFLKVAMEQGIDLQTAKQLVCNTFIGSSKLALKSKLTLQEQIESVTTPGGITAQAVDIFNGGGLDDMIESAVLECIDKANEFDFIYKN